MKRLFFIQLLFLLSACFCSAGTQVIADDIKKPDLIRKQIDYQKKEIKKLQKKITEKNKRMVELNLKKVSVLKQLNELDSKISEQWILLEKTRRKWSMTELELADTEKKISDLKVQNKDMRLLVEKRLRALREMGTLGVLNVLFAADSLNEMMSRETNLRLILNHDRAVRQDFIEKLKALEKEEERLNLKTEELKQLAGSIEETRKKLQVTRREKKDFLQGIEAEGDRYASLIAEMRDAEKSLNAIVANLEKEAIKAEQSMAEAETLKAAVSLYDTASGGDGFAGQRGRLITPAAGKIVIPPIQSDKGKIAGVIFSCPWGSSIKAIYDGKVVLKRNMPGYGKMIIIDHGDHFFTLTSQAIQFFKNPGDKVYEGETIGISGGGPWIDEGIYFEIRHGEYQENPLRWLDVRGVKIIKSSHNKQAVKQ